MKYFMATHLLILKSKFLVVWPLPIITIYQKINFEIVVVLAFFWDIHMKRKERGCMILRNSSSLEMLYLMRTPYRMLLEILVLELQFSWTQMKHHPRSQLMQAKPLLALTLFWIKERQPVVQQPRGLAEEKGLSSLGRAPSLMAASYARLGKRGWMRQHRHHLH